MSNSELFEKAYRSIWMSLHRRDDPDLSQHERDILSHIPPDGCSLGDIVRHLALPKSTCSEIVKSLAQRGFVNRVRDAADDRRIRLTLAREGRARVADDRVLEPAGLARALARLPTPDRSTLLRLMRKLAAVASSSQPADPRGM